MSIYSYKETILLSLSSCIDSVRTNSRKQLTWRRCCGKIETFLTCCTSQWRKSRRFRNKWVRVPSHMSLMRPLPLHKGKPLEIRLFISKDATSNMIIHVHRRGSALLMRKTEYGEKKLLKSSLSTLKESGMLWADIANYINACVNSATSFV